MAWYRHINESGEVKLDLRTQVSHFSEMIAMSNTTKWLGCNSSSKYLLQITSVAYIVISIIRQTQSRPQNNIALNTLSLLTFQIINTFNITCLIYCFYKSSDFCIVSSSLTACTFGWSWALCARVSWSSMLFVAVVWSNQLLAALQLIKHH